MTVPVTSDLAGYIAFWRPIVMTSVSVIVVLLVIIAVGIWRK